MPSPEPVPPPRECSKKKLCRRRNVPHRVRNASRRRRTVASRQSLAREGQRGIGRGTRHYFQERWQGPRYSHVHAGMGLSCTGDCLVVYTRARRAPTRAPTGRGCLQRVARLCGRARLLEDLLAILRSCSSLGSPRATLHRYAAPCRRRVPQPSAAQAAAGRATLHGCATRGVLQVHGTLGTCRMLHARPQDRGTKSGGEC